MPIFAINTPVRIFKSKEYGERLIFINAPVNPRDELGKIGISFHSDAGSYVYRTISVRLPVIAEDGSRSLQVFRINRGSFIKYLHAFDPAFVIANKTDEELVDHFNTIAWNTENLNSGNHDFAMQQSKAGEQGLRHAGEHNTQLVNPGLLSGLNFYFSSMFYSWLYHVTITSLTGLKARFLLVGSEKALLETSSTLAMRRFKEAARDVPAYRAHLAADKSAAAPRTFADVPPTTKANYIKINSKHDWDTHKGGRYPVKGKTDTSTGTTGKPTPWVRSAVEVDNVISTFQIAAAIEFGDRPINYINSFALGMWATGMTVYEAMRRTGNVFTTGTNKQAILEKLESIYAYENEQIRHELDRFIATHTGLQEDSDKLHAIVTQLLNGLLDNKNYNLSQEAQTLLSPHLFMRRYVSEIVAIVEKLNKTRSQIVIAGYPPFLKDLIDEATRQGIDFARYHARGIVGGQAVSEALRDKLIQGGFTSINSSYGASDLDINMGAETRDFETRIRKAIECNPGLARELYGANKSLPMVFHFDPFNYHIECLRLGAMQDELLFTCNRDDRSSPRIRYDLGDKGRVYAVSDILALLAKYGITNLKPNTNLPILMIWGRESTIVYGGANVAYTELERALTMVDEGEHVAKSAFYSYEDKDGKEQFEIWLELKEGVAIPDQETSQAFLRAMLAKMLVLNQDFRWQVDALDLGAQLPSLRFFARHQSPISEPDGVRKQVLVFQRGTTLPADYQYPNDPAQCQFSVIQKDKLFVEALNGQKLEISGDKHASDNKGKAHTLSLFRPAEGDSPSQRLVTMEPIDPKATNAM